MKNYLIPSLLLVLSFLATSCIHSPLGMETGDVSNTSAPAAAPIASPEQEQPEPDSKEQAALDKALLEAAKEGDIAAVASVLDRGAYIEAKSYGGYTALHWAAECGHLTAARFLLDRGVDIDSQDNEGQNALEVAKAEAHQEVVN